MILLLIILLYMDQTMNITCIIHFMGRVIFAGCIFMNCENTDIDLDQNVILYGHNMKNGTMFADLRKYIEKDFWEQHKYNPTRIPELEIIFIEFIPLIQLVLPVILTNIVLQTNKVFWISLQRHRNYPTMIQELNSQPTVRF